MNTSYLELSYLQVGLAALLIVVNGGISIALQLRLERSLALAAVRTIVQLLLIGIVLEWVFRIDHALLVLGLLIVMTMVAALTSVQRTERRYAGIWWDTILSIGVSSWLVTSYALVVVLNGIDKWYQPQYAIPLLGMVLGNTLTGVSLGQNALTTNLQTHRDQVELVLALGGTRWEAARNQVRHAVRTGMIPITNAMMVVGLVSLPGMMTGQILSGVSPLEAVKYQIAIMFLIASATALGTVSITLLGYRRLFNADHQFLADRLSDDHRAH